ncbi:hypothetical protein LHK_01804 [Laribacter hongkongensis HLHK9]|uniref:Uncharacterized protein n=1 Tax=Laribacter hongkongensis (strain HLHK9) TaxID=557598 RepID=C1D8J8_LARHH|nr:hypothetical protein LHK_01804 [Laribacter hongkongensis HLHK9]
MQQMNFLVCAQQLSCFSPLSLLAPLRKTARIFFVHELS